MENLETPSKTQKTYPTQFPNELQREPATDSQLFPVIISTETANVFENQLIL